MIATMPLRTRRSRSPFLARLGRPALSLALLTAGLVLAGAFVGVAVQGSGVDREKRSLIDEIAALERANAERRAEIERRNTEEYVIETARDYGYVRPGEGMIAVEGDEPGEASIAELPAFSVERVARWWNVFFGVR